MSEFGPSSVADARSGPTTQLPNAGSQQWDVLLDCLPVGVCICDLDGVVTRFNERAVEIWGMAPNANGRRERFIAAQKAYWPDGRPIAADDSPMNVVLRTGQPLRDCEVVVERPDGSRLPVLANIDPLRDADGELAGAVSCFQDISEVKRAQRRADRLDGWIRQVIEDSPVAMYTTDADGRVLSFNRAAQRLWGRAPRLGEDRWCGSHRLFHPDGRPMPLGECPLAQALKAGQAVQGLEALFERPDGTRGAFLAYPTLLRDQTGETMGAVNMLVDISERKLAEDRQRILVDELNHRVKNTLASVQSLAAHSLRGEDDPKTMRQQFEARILALSNAHNQLADRRWRDAELRDLAGAMLAPYAADHRVAMDGETLALSSRTAVSLSLVLHELATNAVKYGALSRPEGRLALSWRRLGEDRVVLEWREADGPAVSPPSRRGFGARFIAGAVEGELGGRIEHVYDPTGVRCRIEVPI